LSRESCEYILEFVKTRPWFVQFFRNTTLSDEMFFQTILGNSSFKEKIHRNLMYTDWSNQKAHPANINQQHLEHFKMNRRLVIEDHYGRGEVLFARKFTDDSGELVKQLDKIRNSV
ncbi:MAG: beta-1,6-N-acetylglucosaminyltransferase, partial [Bacillota bacterium]